LFSAVELDYARRRTEWRSKQILELEQPVGFAGPVVRLELMEVPPFARPWMELVSEPNLDPLQLRKDGHRRDMGREVVPCCHSRLVSAVPCTSSKRLELESYGIK